MSSRLVKKTLKIFRDNLFLIYSFETLIKSQIELQIAQIMNQIAKICENTLEH